MPRGSPGKCLVALEPPGPLVKGSWQQEMCPWSEEAQAQRGGRPKGLVPARGKPLAWEEQFPSWSWR